LTDRYRKQYEKAFQELVGTEGARALSRCRQGLFVLLKALSVESGDRVGVCGYTCLSVIEPVKYCGATPVYLDVDEYGCIDPARLAEQSKGSLKAVILQHTLGVPGQLDQLLSQCKRIGAGVIEDCAQAMGCCWRGAPLGTFGDGAAYSFGWGKSYTTGWGGMLTVNSRSLLRKVDACLEELALPERLLPELFIAWQRKVYKWFVKTGREAMLTHLYPQLRDSGIVGGALPHTGEFHLRPGYLRLAGERTCLAGLKQLEAWPRIQRKRRENTKRIEAFLGEVGLPLWPIPPDADVTLLCYPVLTAHKQKVLAIARRMRLDLSGGYDSPVYPLKGAELAAVDYEIGSCARAKELARTVVAIPTASSAMQHTLENAGAVLLSP